MKTPIAFLALAFPFAASAAVTVQTEQIGIQRADWNAPAWDFKIIGKPSQSAASRGAAITIVGRPEASCLAPGALANGVMPQQTRLRRDFFTFANGTDGGLIVMDLGKVIAVAEINSYSAHGPVGGTTWAEEFDGVRGPQVYALYASAAARPDPRQLDGADWVKLADVDTRPKPAGAKWGGRWGINIRDDSGALLGRFRWLVWQVKPTLTMLAPGHVPRRGTTNPEWSNTWFAELDVHTPESLTRAGDFIPAGAQLKEVIVAYKTHFDIGFTHPAPEIVNIYRTSMIDAALKLIEASCQAPPEERFAWTIPSWVAWQILWDGQDTARRARITQAMQEGSLVVHALPVTVHTETLELADLVAGLDLHRQLCRKVGIPLSRAGKMTDVPSHSWILPTLLRHAGIEFLHLGCNPGNERPEVPLLYDWEGPDGSRLLTMHPQGYGSDNEFGHGLYPPKDWPYARWLAVMTACDNVMPPSAEAVKQLLEEARRNLPGVKVRFGRMEDFADGIRAEQQAGAKIPVVRADMPDCWIHGIGSAPETEALARQTRPQLAAVESLDTHLRLWGQPRADIREAISTARERSLMYGEHTWGSARNLEGRKAYTMTNFAGFVANDATCKFLETTWADHAGYIRKAAAIADQLGSNALAQLAANVAVAGPRAVVFNPLPQRRDARVEINGRPVFIKDLPPSGYKTIALPQDKPGQGVAVERTVLENAFLKVTVDRARGGVVSIVEKAAGRELVDPAAKHAFGQYVIEKFDRQQLDAYQIGCVHLDTLYGPNARVCAGWNVRGDLPASPAYASASPAYSAMAVRRHGPVQEAVLTAAPAGIIESGVTTTITLVDDAPWLEIAVRLEDKQPNYWPEAGSLCFAVNAAKPQFRLGRLGGVVNPATDFPRGCNRTYGYVNSGAMIAGADGRGVALCPLDHGLMSFGEKGLGTIDPGYVPSTATARVSLFNNFWTTNFRYWIRGMVFSRVRVWPTANLDPASLTGPALEARQPVHVGIGDGPAGKLPAEQVGLALSRADVQVVAFGQHPGGPGTLLRVWEQAGQAGKLTVAFPAGSKFTAAQPVNLRAEPAGKPIAVRDGKISFNLPACAPASFVLTPELPVAPVTPNGPTTITPLLK
jgi:hypothetical protein